jgi:Glu-tRNA(Gln) amidotransferase subunit E-like FAD-binding protein
MSSVTDKSINKSTDSAAEVKTFFDRYFSKSISITSNEVDTVLGFFTKRNFDKSSAIAVTTVILQQSKSEGKNVFELLDSLTGLDEVKLSQLVSAILNNNRSKISALGYTVAFDKPTQENRNVLL